MRISATIVATALSLSACLVRPPDLAFVPNGMTALLPVETRTLPNGLTVMLSEDHRAPLVRVLVAYAAGTTNDPPGRAGIAHLVEHLMFRGSRNAPDGAFSKYLEQAGATDVNATTTRDTTSYYEVVPSSALELALWLESDRMAFGFSLSSEGVYATEREVVKSEVRDRRRRAYADVYPLVSQVLFPPGHPYHLRTLDPTEDLDRASLGDARQFAEAFYRPNNATLVVTGDIDKEGAWGLVAKYFAKIPAAPVPAAPAFPPITLPRPVTLRIDASVEAPFLVMAWPTRSYFQPDDAELDVLAYLLEQGGHQLCWKLHDELKIVSTCRVRQSSGLHYGTFWITAELTRDSSPERVRDVVDEALERFRKTARASVVVEISKLHYQSQLIFHSESLAGRSSAFLSYARSAGDPSFFDRDVARYREVQPSDVRRAAALLLPEGRVMAIVTPRLEAPPAGRLVSTE